MFYPIKLDLVPLLENLVAAIQPYAKANSLKLRIEHINETIEIYHHPEFLISELTKLICRIIAFTPQDFKIVLNTQTPGYSADNTILIRINNACVTQEVLQEHILQDIKLKVELRTSKANESLFTVHIPGVECDDDGNKQITEQLTEIDSGPVSPFYLKLRKHLKSHFTSIQNLEQAADLKSQREGIFLKKINAVIIAHLDKEGFDAVTLGKALALSRTQLYRRLKPLIGFSPAHYIRFVKLSKAKEFLNNEDLTVSEVAFKTGFKSHSHFTRVFRKQFGYTPSNIRQLKSNNSRT